MRIRWYGHASFHVASTIEGRSVFLDPFGKMDALIAGRGAQFDYPPIAGVAADLVLVTHEHMDHNGVEAIAGDPTVIRAVGGTLESPVGPVTAVVGDHDTVAGTQRGMNTIFAFHLEGLRLAHFGDYGQASLRTEQEAALGRVDLLFVPVGGGPTIDAEGAAELVRRLRPRFVVPMHYRSTAVNFLSPVDPFVARYDRVVRLSDAAFDTADLPQPSGDEPVVVVPAVPRA